MDDDSFVATSGFYREDLQPLLEAEQGTHFLIGRRLQGKRPYTYPGGQFHTLSWETTTAIVQQYEEIPIADEHEHILIGRLLSEISGSFDMIPLENQMVFDYIREMATNGHGLKTSPKR